MQSRKLSFNSISWKKNWLSARVLVEKRTRQEATEVKLCAGLSFTSVSRLFTLHQKEFHSTTWVNWFSIHVILDVGGEKFLMQFVDKFPVEFPSRWVWYPPSAVIIERNFSPIPTEKKSHHVLNINEHKRCLATRNENCLWPAYFRSRSLRCRLFHFISFSLNSECETKHQHEETVVARHTVPLVVKWSWEMCFQCL